MIGMNIEAVRHLGGGLKAQAASLRSVQGRVDSVVNSIQNEWKGIDAQAFCSWWRNEHRPTLIDLVSKLEGLGQSASNNADEQERASGGGGGSASSGMGVDAGSGPPFSEVPSAPSTQPSPNPSDQQRAAAAAFVSKYENTRIDYDGHYNAQCFDVFQKYSHTVAGVPGNVSIAVDSNNASDIYQHYATNGVSSYYDQVPYGQGVPQPGDIIVYGASKANGGYGHVALVTEVNGNQYDVLEQNYYDKVLNPTGEGLVPAAVHSYTFNDSVLGYLRPKTATGAP